MLGNLLFSFRNQLVVAEAVESLHANRNFWDGRCWRVFWRPAGTGRVVLLAREAGVAVPTHALIHQTLKLLEEKAKPLSLLRGFAQKVESAFSDDIRTPTEFANFRLELPRSSQILAQGCFNPGNYRFPK
jgi:hypothetical protein